MTVQLLSRYQRCFISAPIGLGLGALPEVLGEYRIAWDWAANNVSENLDARSGIEKCDFLLVIFNGTKADYRSAFDAGIAIGLSKPIFLIQTKSRALPIDLSRFTVVKTNLTNRDALRFHLDIFLAASTMMPAASDNEASRSEAISSVASLRNPDMSFDSMLERRAYEAIIAGGGSAISHPRSDTYKKYRPDLLAWLGNVDPDLLDPVVIEVKADVESRSAAELDERLLKFIQATRVKMALVLTDAEPVKREQQLSPNVLWLSINEFEKLMSAGQLSQYLRDLRNRILHRVR